MPAKYIESSDTEGEISREENTYFSFEHQFRGKLQTGTMFGKVNSAGLIRKREINYDYCNDNVYYGLVKSITYDDGKKISYNYQGQGGVESSVVAKVLQRDGQIKTKQFKHFLYQIYPFKSTVSVTPSNSYSFYTAYNFAGDLLYRVDENQYYSKYEYDSKHRLVAEYNPGSFLDDRNVSAVDTLRSEKKISLAITISDDGKEYIEKTLNMSENPQTSNNTPMQSEDGINRIAESEEGEANSLISYKAFVFLDDPIDLTDVTNVNNAKITVSMKDADLGGRSGIHVFCKAVSKSLSEQNNQYTTIADSVFQFTDGKGELIFDVKSILTTAKLAGSKVFGFKFYLEKPSAGEAAVKLAFDAENLPTIEYDLEKYSSVLASTNYKYVDNYYIPKVTANVTLEFGDGESKKVYSTEHGFRGGSLESYVKFIPFGQNTFESTKKINFLGLPIVQKTGEGISQYSYYDGFGKLSKTTYDKNITGSSITREYNMDASTWNLVYFTETYTDADGKKIESTYDWKESLISKKQGDLPAATFQYNLLKQLVQVNTPGGKIIKYGYDDWGIINSKQTPDGGLEKYKLDRFGRQRFLINADAPQNSAKITFLRYDILGQVIAAGEISSTQYSYDELDPDFSYAAGANHFENMESDFSNFFVVNMYDSYVKTGAFANLDDPAESIVEKNRIGRLVAVAFRDKLEDPWNYKVYSYDAQGNVLYYYIKFRSTAWKKIENKYDHAGNLVKQSVNPENPQESIFYWYEYNDLGKLTGTFSSKIDNYSTAIKDFTMEYNKDAKIKKITYPYISNMANNFLSFNYQNRGLISALSGGFTSGLSYNLNGNLSSAFYTVYNGSSYQFSYFYDSANRLIYVNNQDVLFENFSYDADGNILLKKSLDEQITFNYSQTNNRLSSIKKNDDPNLKYYSYDYCGRMVEDQNRGISGISYRYSDQMLSYTQNGHEFSYSYDDEGNRIYKSNQDEFSLIDNFGKEIAVYDFTRGKVKYFNLFALGLNGRIETSFLSPDNRDDKRFYYMKDHLGSVRRTYTAEGELVYTNEYSAFGGSLNSYNTGGAIHNDYFTGKIKDTETGYNYFGARFYDSQICRWLTPDPLSDDTPEFNPYNYCVNNPVNYKDPSGLDSSDTQDNDVDIMLPDLFEYPKTFFVDGKKIPSSTAIPTSETIGSASNVSPKKDEIDIQGVVISVAGLAAGETAKTLFDANQKTFFDFISWSKQKFSSRSIKKMNIKVLKSKSLAGKVKILGFVLSGVSLYLNYRDYGKTQDNYVHCQLIFDASFNFIGAFSPVVGVSYSIGKVMGQKITETEGYKYFRDNLYVPSERMHRDFYGKYPQLQAIDWMGVK
ncbi:MAG: RHS repeat-associated core domain-containing protein [Ignavibacteriales bacterium]|nr:RHS repeat-associated core domain-containing protein [Ignavibacteriales bacterium]